jgi:hypothetical protein
MMDRESLTKLALEIAAQGFDHATASQFAVLIGDTPIRDSAGRIVVQDDAGRILATLPPLNSLFEL